MRLLFLLALSCWVAGAARAQKLPVVADTATLSFMRWYWSSQNPRHYRHARLYYLTASWREAAVAPGDTATDFSHKLSYVHQADTASYTSAELRHYRIAWQHASLPADSFSREDLAAMRQQYDAGPTRWPDYLTRLTQRHSHGAKVVTRPLFSLDGKRAVVWELSSGPGASAALRVYARTAADGWQFLATLNAWVE